jgi:hypothetical protein
MSARSLLMPDHGHDAQDEHRNTSALVNGITGGASSACYVRLRITQKFYNARTQQDGFDVLKFA